MTLENLANLVFRMVGNGQVKVTNITMTQALIQGYLQVAYGGVIQSVIDKKKKNGELDPSYLVSGAIATEKFPVEKSGRYSVLDISETAIMRVDTALQIVGFETVGDEDDCHADEGLETISYVSPYEERYYKGGDYAHLMFFSLAKGQVRIYNLPECVKELNMTYAQDGPNIDLPADVCLQVVKLALADIMGIKKSVDREKIDDNSNDVIHQLKMALGK